MQKFALLAARQNSEDSFPRSLQRAGVDDRERCAALAAVQSAQAGAGGLDVRKRVLLCCGFVPLYKVPREGGEPALWAS